MVALAGVQPALSRSMQRLETALQVSLWDGVYQLIILPHPVEEAGVTCAKYGEEHLFFSLPPAHPLSGSKALYMKALNGESFRAFFQIDPLPTLDAAMSLNFINSGGLLIA